MVRNFLDAFIKGEFEAAAELDGGDHVLESDEDETNNYLIGLILSKVSYEMGDTNIEGTEVEVSVRVTAPNPRLITGTVIGDLFPPAFALAFSKEDPRISIPWS